MDVSNFQLTPGQFGLVQQIFSLCFATMFAAFVYFMVTRRDASAKYRPAIIVSGLVVLIASYHYLRIYESWNGAFTLEGGSYVPTGEAFDSAYRYADWLLTVPLLMVELVYILALTRSRALSLKIKLITAAVLMIVTGYMGQSSLGASQDSTGALLFWGTVSTIPFVYILAKIWQVVGEAMSDMPDEAATTARNLRLLFLGSWGVYPIAYLVLGFASDAAWLFVGVQVAYTIADLIAKPGYGMLLHKIAVLRSEAEGYVESSSAQSPASPSPSRS